MTASPGSAPSAAVRPPPPRLRSRVFSTPQRFPGTPGLRGLVSCRSHPWGSSLRSLAPRRGRAPLSGPLASLRFSTGRQSELLVRGLVPRVSPTPTPTRDAVAWIPTGASCAVSTAPACRHARTASPTPWTAPASIGRCRRHRLRPLRSLLPSTKPYHGAGEAACVALAPLGFRPSRALLRSTLGPSHPADRSVHPRASSPARRRGVRSPAVR